MLKENKGVTLVALVITIIVLLILAGVTLSMVMGDSGIFSKANKASSETTISSAKDAVRLALLEVTTAQYNDDGTINQTKKVTEDNASEKVATQMAKTGEYVLDAGKVYKATDTAKENAIITVSFSGDPVTVSFEAAE